MHPMIEKYGKQAISELLDMVEIKRQLNDGEWRHFLLKHGIIKQTTKVIHGYINEQLITQESVPSLTGYGYVTRPLQTPYKIHRIFARNGRGTEVFRINYKSTELEQIWEELK